MVYINTQFKQTQIQMLLQEFEYEIKDGWLNLYERITSKQEKDILRFLAQVPVDENCTVEESVKQAVDRVNEYLGLPTMRIKVKSLSEAEFLPKFDYIR